MPHLAFAFTREGISDRNAVAGVLWIAVALTGTLGRSGGSRQSLADNDAALSR